MLTYLVPLIALCAGPNIVINGTFGQGLHAWKPSSAQVPMGVVEVDGKPAARVTVPPGETPAYPGLFQEFAVAPGDVFEAHVEAKARGVTGGYGAYAALEFHAGNRRLTYVQTRPVKGDEDWTTLSMRGVAPPNARTARLVILVNGHGEGLFRDVCVVRIGNVEPKPLNGPVTLKVTRDVVCDSFLGFGFEDDGWFYNPENAAHGVTKSDYALNEARIAWMAPKQVRMFFWIKDYCPTGDWKTFTFDSPNMLSHYRTLDLYQRLGTDVNVTGVEWGLDKPYADPAKAARGIAHLLEYLVKDKGYTCIKYWTLTNEPNDSWTGRHDTFKKYVELTRLVKQELRKRGLPIQVIGSDDTAGFDWFKRCVDDKTYYKTADLFASHRYTPYPDRVLAPYFFRERLHLLAKQSPRKPFLVEEFGFQDSRSGTFKNPIMKTYPYAIWTTAFCIQGLNLGVAGFSIWAVHEVYYPGGGFMQYALWDYKTDGWKVRPVYYAWANFTRLARKGAKVRRCDSSNPSHVLGALVGDTLFWVNQGDKAAEVRIEGFDPKEVRIQTESTLHGDRECGSVKPLAHGRFTAPPQSFGYAK